VTRSAAIAGDPARAVAAVAVTCGEAEQNQPIDRLAAGADRANVAAIISKKE
jgi:hypothetical protein